MSHVSAVITLMRPWSFFRIITSIRTGGPEAILAFNAANSRCIFFISFFVFVSAFLHSVVTFLSSTASVCDAAFLDSVWLGEKAKGFLISLVFWFVWRLSLRWLNLNIFRPNLHL